MTPESVSSAAVAEQCIRVLPDALVDQIAAGEVIDRPASVVKELVENAIDAGASHIAIDVENGGKRLIRVLDNGCGMTAEQARLALQRHATSKLRSFDDLFTLSTMGFRGEALPSIASVSTMRLVTRTHVDVVGTELSVEAGRVITTKEVAAPVGTHIEVVNLLANVPARLKFLKGNATESSHITDAVNKLAMAHPHIHFRLRHNARTTVNAPMHKSAFERPRSLLGSRLGRRLHRVHNVESGIEVQAFLAAPELAQTTSRGVQMFVGRRAVRDRGLLHAIGMGYGELIGRGRYPVAVLFIDIPGDSVDVNVHPQKMEVRFSEPQTVYAAVRHTVARGVGQAPWLREQPAIGSAPVRMRAIAANTPPRLRPTAMASHHAAERTKLLLPWHKTRTVAYNQVQFPVKDPMPVPRAVAPRAVAPPPVARAAEPPPTTIAELDPTFFSDLRYIGQLDRTYLICEARNELVLLDQHAAHERVEFQRVRQRYQQRAVSVQRLLFPRTLEVSAEQAAIAAESAAELVALGFELELDEARPTHVTIRAVPASLSSDAVDVLRALLDELVEHGGSRAVEERLDLMFATIACHSVVRAGDSLSPREAQALLSSLDAVDFRAHCPHGRPVLLRISIAEIARRFGRT